MISDHGAQDARNWSGSLPLNTKGCFIIASAGSSWRLLVLEEYLQMGRNILHVLIVNWHVDEGSTWVEKLPNHLSFLSSSIDVHMQHNLHWFCTFEYILVSLKRFCDKILYQTIIYYINKLISYIQSVEKIPKLWKMKALLVFQENTNR